MNNRLYLFARRHLSRVTTGRPVLNEVDTLRFVAIAGVILFHIHGSTPGRPSNTVTEPYLRPVVDLFLSGHFGRKLLFMMSGFLLVLPFARHHFGMGGAVSLKKYFRRRLSRIEPPYIIHVVIMSLLFLLIWPTGWIWPPELLAKVSPVPFMLRHNAASLVYQHGLLAGYPNPLNVVLWSLEILIQFYFLLPLLAFIFLIRAKLVRRLLLVGGMALFSWLESTIFLAHSWTGLTVLFYLHWFLPGLLLADFYLLDWQEKSPNRWWDACGILSWAIIITQTTWPARGWLAHLLPLVLLAACASAFRGRWLNKIFRNPWTAMLGAQCYTIYLYHYLVIQVAGRFVQGMFPGDRGLVTLLVHAVLVTGAVLAVSLLMFVLFERPFMFPDWPARVKARPGSWKRSAPGSGPSLPELRREHLRESGTAPALEEPSSPPAAEKSPGVSVSEAGHDEAGPRSRC